MIKKLNNNEGVFLSSTVKGQRELLRQYRNKINEIIEYLDVNKPTHLVNIDGGDVYKDEQRECEICNSEGCGGCGYMGYKSTPHPTETNSSPKHNEGWEKEFDKLFMEYLDCGGAYQDPVTIKAFIRKLLEEQK